MQDRNGKCFHSKIIFQACKSTVKQQSLYTGIQRGACVDLKNKPTNQPIMLIPVIWPKICPRTFIWLWTPIYQVGISCALSLEDAVLPASNTSTVTVLDTDMG